MNVRPNLDEYNTENLKLKLFCDMHFHVACKLQFNTAVQHKSLANETSEVTNIMRDLNENDIISQVCVFG